MNAAATALPPACQHCGNRLFEYSGAMTHEVSAAPPDLTQLRRNIVAIAIQEWRRWNDGGLRTERDPRMRRVLADYWRRGAGVAVRETDLGSTQFQKNHPWSAAFISWVMRQAGAGAAFRYSAGHAVYVSAAKRNRLQNNGNPFRAYRVSEARPALGDLVCKSRANSGATYDNVRPGMFSHCDIVVAVEPQRVWVIGGNVNQSVARRAVPLTADGRLAPPEYFAVVKIENPSGRSSEVAATPAASLGRTIYAPIDLKIQDRFGRVRPQTGIFCPNGWNPGQAVDLVIYLHGIRNVATIESYWNGRRSRYFALREDLVASGRNAVLVAPLLGQRSQDQIGTLARAGGLDHFCNQVLAALSVQAPVGNIVLACHSGGGLAARTIALANNRLAPVIRECWGFDCTYNSNDHVVWPRWATRRPNGRLFLYYINTPRRGTEPQATKIRALNVPNISVIPSRTNDHNAVPRAYFLERLRNCPFLRNI